MRVLTSDGLTHKEIGCYGVSNCVGSLDGLNHKKIGLDNESILDVLFDGLLVTES